MMPVKLVFSIIGLTGLGVGVGLTIRLLGAPGVGSKGGVNGTTTSLNIESYSGPPAPVVAMSYGAVSFEEMMKGASVILAGKVTNIGETKWNKDSGAYWEETIKDEIGETTVTALPYYEVTISLGQVIADSFGITDQLVVTVVGTSPADYPIATEDFGLTSGADIIAFVEQGEIAWGNEVTYNEATYSFESAMKPVLRFMGYPRDSCLLKGEDGLYRFLGRPELSGPFSSGELTRLIQEKRGMP